MKELKENDRLENANKELETKESSIVNEMNLLKHKLEEAIRRIKDLEKTTSRK